jgi:hypothetical protein
LVEAPQSFTVEPSETVCVFDKSVSGRGPIRLSQMFSRRLVIWIWWPRKCSDLGASRNTLCFAPPRLATRSQLSKILDKGAEGDRETEETASYVWRWNWARCIRPRCIPDEEKASSQITKFITIFSGIHNLDPQNILTLHCKIFAKCSMEWPKKRLLLLL